MSEHRMVEWIPHSHCQPSEELFNPYEKEETVSRLVFAVLCALSGAVVGSIFSLILNAGSIVIWSSTALLALLFVLLWKRKV